ncbi:hypothetical protein CO230_00120 [Chryseobacterium sp. 6424]|uniref:energy transducer TonB n=1 Tax=Chryseobacterium sp. 6424 TaxID=2039166 RepID=UPI000EFA9C7D|nr:hypothetical protein [Chryseobacterium sp. 6424]AYO56681.1 hypothetical protein CO230_00120 [Chryseobacterium sp. 6424]
MKKLLLSLLFSCSFLQAQYLIDDNDITENNKEVGRVAIAYDFSNPMEFYRLKCENPTYAQYPRGENGFKDTLLLNMKGYLDTALYSVNGTFELHFTVDKTGRIKNFELKPEVPNGHLLRRDIELTLRQMNVKWNPATCNGMPIESRVRQKINFITEVFDI